MHRISGKSLLKPFGDNINRDVAQPCVCGGGGAHTNNEHNTYNSGKFTKSIGVKAGKPAVSEITGTLVKHILKFILR